MRRLGFGASFYPQTVFGIKSVLKAFESPTLEIR